MTTSQQPTTQTPKQAACCGISTQQSDPLCPRCHQPRRLVPLPEATRPQSQQQRATR